jgi:S1-C subfamily serine protease
MRRFVAIGPSLVVLLAMAALMLVVPALVQRVGFAQQSARVVLARQTLEDDDILERLNAAIRNVAETVEPSIVHIESISGGGETGWRRNRSSGSGWIFDDAGHVVTNAHVVFGADRVSVQFSDGRTTQATVLPHPDALTDIAVLKLEDTRGLVPIRRATGLEPHKGDRVFVFGSPFGFKFSMSEGIISGLGRDADTPGVFNEFTNFIQTDAAVNPGNSGGPLIDIKGRLIGMNVAIATGRGDSESGRETGQSAGISFAIPLGTIESVVQQVIEKGKIRRGYLGVSWQERWGPTARYYPAIKRVGMQVGDVIARGPSDQAGIQPGDIITGLDGLDVTSTSVLRSVITARQPGAAVRVTYYRDGERQETKVTLGEFPVMGLAGRAAERALASMGMDVGRISRPEDDPFVIVDVGLDTPALRAGLKAGHRIVEVNGQAVQTYERAIEAMVDAGLLVGSPVSIGVRETDAGEITRTSLRLPRVP